MVGSQWSAIVLVKVNWPVFLSQNDDFAAHSLVRRLFQSSAHFPR